MFTVKHVFDRTDPNKCMNIVEAHKVSVSLGEHCDQTGRFDRYVNCHEKSDNIEYSIYLPVGDKGVIYIENASGKTIQTVEPC